MTDKNPVAPSHPQARPDFLGTRLRLPPVKLNATEHCSVGKKLSISSGVRYCYKVLYYRVPVIPAKPVLSRLEGAGIQE